MLRTGKKPYRKPTPTIADSLPKDSTGNPLGHVPEVRYKVVDLPAWDFDKLVGGTVLRLTLGMLHKMTGGELDDFSDALLPLAELPEGEQVELTKELAWFIVKAFQAHNRRVDAEMLGKALHSALKGKEQKMIKTIFEEREEIGEARGKAEEGRNMVLAVLRARFNRIPKSVEKAVCKMSDPVALESWAVQAATCKSMAEFAESLQ